MANYQLAQFAGFGAYTTAGMHDFPYKKNLFHRETANRSRTSVTFLFLANASRLFRFRIGFRRLFEFLDFYEVGF